jgi:hypothetical protein
LKFQPRVENSDRVLVPFSSRCNFLSRLAGYYGMFWGEETVTEETVSAMQL